jgi:hypothetical protein
MCDDPNHDHTLNWANQNRLRKEWLEQNPEVEFQGWTSI